MGTLPTAPGSRPRGSSPSPFRFSASVRAVPRRRRTVCPVPGARRRFLPWSAFFHHQELPDGFRSPPRRDPHGVAVALPARARPRGAGRLLPARARGDGGARGRCLRGQREHSGARTAGRCLGRGAHGRSHLPPSRARCGSARPLVPPPPMGRSDARLGRAGADGPWRDAADLRKVHPRRAHRDDSDQRHRGLPTCAVPRLRGDRRTAVVPLQRGDRNAGPLLGVAVGIGLALLLGGGIEAARVLRRKATRSRSRARSSSVSPRQPPAARVGAPGPARGGT